VKKRILVGLLVVASAGALAGGVYYTWLITPPRLPSTAEEGLQAMGTARYRRLADYRKQAHVTRTQELVRKMSDKDRGELFRRVRTDEGLRRAIREFRETEMVQRMREYTRGSPAEKIKLLDEDIDRQERWRAERQSRRQQAQRDGTVRDRRDGRGEGRGPGRAGFQQRIQRRIEHGNPQRMALRMEYFRAIRERRKQRGLPDRPPGPPRGRGGPGGLARPR